jgi:hypothetical protein
VCPIRVRHQKASVVVPPLSEVSARLLIEDLVNLWLKALLSDVGVHLMSPRSKGTGKVLCACCTISVVCAPADELHSPPSSRPVAYSCFMCAVYLFPFNLLLVHACISILLCLSSLLVICPSVSLYLPLALSHSRYFLPSRMLSLGVRVSPPLVYISRSPSVSALLAAVNTACAA